MRQKKEPSAGWAGGSYNGNGYVEYGEYTLAVGCMSNFTAEQRRDGERVAAGPSQRGTGQE